ncbi:MAG: hydrogenase nickel incorporation protein HypB [Planctomycetota bacterium]
MSEKKKVEIQKPVLSKNDRIAAQNRRRLEQLGIYCINLISSPGSGKTTLLERLAGHFGPRMACIEGDLQTRRDAERVQRAGVLAHQIETDGACHLDAAEVAAALDVMDLGSTEVELLVIENVGNLVCPSSFELGEHMKVGMLSVPEGDDKVLKYPSIFSRVGVMIVNKIDLLPYMDFDVERAVEECRSINSDVEVFRLAAKTGEHVEAFCRYLEEKQSALTGSSRV